MSDGTYEFYLSAAQSQRDRPRSTRGQNVDGRPHLFEDDEEVVGGHEGHGRQLEALDVRQAGHPRRVSDAPAPAAAGLERRVEALVAVGDEQAVQREGTVHEEVAARLEPRGCPSEKATRTLLLGRRHSVRGGAGRSYNGRG